MTGGATVGEVKGAALENLAVAERLFRNNNLRLNTDKTQSMVCTIGRSLAANSTTQDKLLKFVIDRRLNWQHHIEDVCNKLSRVDVFDCCRDSG